MVNEKESKNKDLEKLHRILDDLSLEDINDDDKKYLISLAMRIKENYGPIYKTKKDEKEKEFKDKETKNENLNPKVKVHHEENKILPKKKNEPSVDRKIKSKDLIEIEKVESAPPEFAEVKPKEKEEKIEGEPEIKDPTVEDFEKKADISEWEAVETEDEVEKENVFYCPHCGSKFNGEYKFCPDCGKKTFLEEIEEDIEKEEEWEKVEEETETETKEKVEPKKKIEDKVETDKVEKKENKTKTKKSKKNTEDKKKTKKEVEEKSLEPEKKPEKKKPKETKKEDKNETLKKEKKEKDTSTNIAKKESDEPWSYIFDGIDSIDNRISEILFQNGITSLEILKNTNIKDLKKIRGIRGRLAKKIKKDVKELNKESDEVNDETQKNKQDSDEWIAVENDGYTIDEYTLYEKETFTKNGNKRRIRFFSKKQPDKGRPIELPDGYEVKRNKRTKVPYLKKK